MMRIEPWMGKGRDRLNAKDRDKSTLVIAFLERTAFLFLLTRFLCIRHVEQRAAVQWVCLDASPKEWGA